MIQSFRVFTFLLLPLLNSCQPDNSSTNLNSTNEVSPSISTETKIEDNIINKEIIPGSEILKIYLSNKDSADLMFKEKELTISGFVYKVSDDKYNLLLDYIGGK